MSRNLVRTALLLLAMGSIGVAPAAAQRRQSFDPPRLYVSAFAGRFTKVGGFSDDQNSFFSYDDATAFGGSLHYRPGQSAVFGVDVVYSRPSYTRFDRDDQSVRSTGEATALATMASARLSGGGGQAGLYLTGAAGAFFWDAEDLGGREMDPAFNIGIGLDYALRGNAVLFGEYGQWWVYHQKDDSIRKNTANHTLIRLGLRFGF